MGFVSSTLNQPEQWRVWSNMGLEFILAEPGSEVRLFWDNAKAGAVPQTGQPQKATGEVETTRVAPTARHTTPNPSKTTAAGESTFPQTQSSNKTSFQASKQMFGQTFEQKTKHLPQAQGQSANQILKGTEEIAPSPHTSLPLLENLPEPWATFASKSKAGRPLLWTYQELAIDLSGKADSARANIIKKIISTLKLPAGSSNFWPHSIPETTTQGQEFKQNLIFFEQGFNALEPQFLLVFGKPSLEAIMPNADCLPYSYTHYNNKVLIYLPCLEQLEDSQKLKKSVEFLQIFTLPCFGGGQ